ncbi:hypothetical protein TNCV_3532971 [Trichonephila clavipes]|nr:hypothetical protein TNCV_3532971 [Trichonephila clavipes]
MGQDGIHHICFRQVPNLHTYLQCRFKIISGPGRRIPPGPFGTGGSKFITRTPGQVQLIWALQGPRVFRRPPPMDNTLVELTNLSLMYNNKILWFGTRAVLRMSFVVI